MVPIYYCVTIKIVTKSVLALKESRTKKKGQKMGNYNVVCQVLGEHSRVT